MVKVLVTGANGLLATNTIVELVKNGYFVKALVRNRNKFILTNNSNIEIVEGDITDYSSIERAIKDCEFVIHAAAETRQGISGKKDYSKVNVTGTENVFNAAIKSSVKRIIHVSTSNVFGFGTKEIPGDETFKIRKPFSDSYYVKSKVEAQKMALSFSDKIEVVVVNPTFMIGACDQKPSSGRIILMGYNKRMIFCPPGGKNFVDVKDASKAIVSSLKRGKNNEAYILSGENLSYYEFFKKLSLHSDRKPFIIKIPSFIIIIVGVFGNFLKLLGFDNETTLTNMRILCVNNYYTNKKAETDLKIKFKGIDKAIDDAIKWFKKNRILKK